MILDMGTDSLQALLSLISLLSFRIRIGRLLEIIQKAKGERTFVFRE